MPGTHIKPASAPTARNRSGPLSWRAHTVYHVMDGSGAALTNLGEPRNMPLGTTAAGNGTIGALASPFSASGSPTGWGTGSEGAYYDFGTTFAGGIINAAASTITFRSGAMHFCFSTPVSLGSTAYGFLRTGSANAAGRFQFFINNSTQLLTLRVRDAANAANLDFTWSGVTLTSVNDLYFEWGPNGCYATFNGVQGTNVNLAAYTGPITIPTGGGGFTINQGTNAGQVKLYSFTMWAEALPSVERDQLLADRYLMLRPNADYSSTDFQLVCVPNCTVKTTSFTTVLTSSNQLSGTLRLRARVATTLTGIASLANDATIYGTFTSTTARERGELTATGLTPDTDYYMRMEQSPDGTNWYPRCGGFQKVRTAAQARAARVCVTADPELNSRSPCLNRILEQRYGTSIYLQDGVTHTERTASNSDTALTDAERGFSYKQHANWMSNWAIYTQQQGTYDFYVDLGDSFWFDISAGYSHGGGYTYTDDNNDHMWRAAVVHRNQHYPILRTMALQAEIPGNHEVMGRWCKIYAGYQALQKQAVSTWVKFTVNPAKNGYGIGEDGDTQAEQMPATTATFAKYDAATAYSPGDLVYPTTDNGLGYIVGGGANGITTAGTEPVSWPLSLGQSTQSGNAITFTRVVRWDAAAKAIWEDDAEGIMAGARRNWFAFDWGTSSFFCADVMTYSRDGEENNAYTENPNLYTLGSTQTAAFTSWADTNTKPHKYLLIHHLPGGEKYLSTTEQWYGRGPGSRCGDTAYYASKGIDEPESQALVDAKMAARGIIGLHGHDHRFCVSTSVRGTIWVSVMSFGSPSIAEPAFGSGSPNRGWNTALHRASYGTNESQGSLDGNGNPTERIIKTLNIVGYVDLQADGSGGTRFTASRTFLPTKPKNGYAHASRTRCDIDRLVGTSALTPSGGFVSLVDTLNPSPKPLDIGIAMLDSNVSAAIGSGVLDETTADALGDTVDDYNVYEATTRGQLVSDVANHGSHSTTTLVQYQMIKPDSPTGKLLRCTVSGVSGASSPSASGDIGTELADGSATVAVIPMGEAPYEWYEPLVGASVPIASGVTDPVRVAWVPQAIYRSDYLQPPQTQRYRSSLAIGRLSIRL